MTPTPLIEALTITKTYTLGKRTITVLRGIDLTVHVGEFVAVMGPSGSGKSTLLHILGCLDRPTSGSYRLDGADMLTSSDRRLSRVRARQIGFVFQTYNLVPTLDIYENVELPFLYAPTATRGIAVRVAEAIERVGLSARRHHRPAQLSGGEMQRVAVARALAVNPKLILADEPTGNLDSDTSGEILELFTRLNRGGVTIVMITHDAEVAARAQRRLLLKDGRFQ